MSTYSGSLRARLILLLVIVLLFSGAVIFVASGNFARSAADEAYDKLLASAALAAMDNLTVIEQQIYLDLPYSSLDTLAQSRDDRVVYRLKTDRGEVLTGQAELPEPDSKALAQAQRLKQPYFFTDDYSGEDFRFVVLEKVLTESGVQGRKVWLQMGQSRLARKELSRDLILRALMGTVSLMLLSGLFVWWAVGWSLKPLWTVEQALLQRQPTDLQALDTQVPTEINHLVKAINRFMRRLQRTQDRNHAFIAEAAHQLRTPLASLQAQAEMALESEEVSDFQQRAARIRRNARETNSRISQLLSYATLAHRTDVLTPEPVVMEAVIISGLADLVPLAIQKGVELDFDNQLGKQQVVVDPEAVREMLRNLVDNALKYGQQDGHKKQVSVSLEASGEEGWVVLQVRDFGPGLPEELLQQVTRRFGRGEFRQHSGSGLGLAIVEQIMYGLGGRLELENGVQGGLKARLLFRSLARGTS